MTRSTAGYLAEKVIAALSGILMDFRIDDCDKSRFFIRRNRLKEEKSVRFIAKLFCTAALFVLLAVSAQAEAITPKEAAYYVGDTATVAGVVSQVSTSNGGTTFINFGGRFPNNKFYAVIFRNNAKKFSGIHSLQGQTVAITGTIELYKGKPQIILLSPSQIEILK